MDVHYLTGLLISDPDKIFGVLEALGYEPKDRNRYITCRNLDGDNSSAIVIYKDKLTYKNYTRDRSGNLITLIMDTKDYSFPEALKWLAKELGVKANRPRVKVHYPFGGFYRNLCCEDVSIIKYTKYNEKELPPSDSLSYKFFQDGITYDIQKKWGVRYDHETDSILIPIRDISGRLIGCKARANKEVDFGHRWYAYLPYQKTSILYGFYEHYKTIIETGKLILVESEKGVLQLESMGCYVGIATGGHDISQIQARYINSLNCKVIIAYDEDLSEEDVEKQSSKLNNCQVWYIKDRCHKYLKFGGKESPTDKGKNILKQLLKECLVKYGG